MKSSSKFSLCSLISVLSSVTAQQQQQQPDYYPHQIAFLSPQQHTTKSLVRISIDSNQSQIDQLNSVLDQFSGEQVDIWRKSSQPCDLNDSTPYLASSSQCTDFATTPEILHHIHQINGIKSTTLIPDIHREAKRQKESQSQRQSDRPSDRPSDRLSAWKHKIFPPHRDPPPDHEPGHHDGDEDEEWHESYHPVEEISSYLHRLASRYPSLARVEEIGRTEENRPIEALIINTKPDSHPTRKVRKFKARTGGSRTASEREEEMEHPPFHVDKLGQSSENKKLGFVLVGELHAREWISSSVLLHFASDLLASTQSQSAPKGFEVFDDFELTLIPLGNPDGYAYTWEEDRFWRKNRQVNRDGDQEGECKGINLGSNWGHAFESSPITESCSESYSGSRAFEAKETLAIRNYIDDRDRNIKGFIELHSYGQLLMYPYSFSCQEAVPDEEDLAEVSLGASRALRNVHGKTYTTGRVCEVLFPSSGSAIDYSYHSSPSRIKWSFSIELRDTGTYGFLLPPKEIKPTSQEFLAALKDLLDFIAKKEKKIR